MKIGPFLFIVMTLSFFGCSPQQKLVSKPPLEIGSPTCQAWVGGRAESGSGTILKFAIKDENMAGQQLQKAYFRGKIADIKMENTAKGWIAKANFFNENPEKPDIIMDSDSTKEVGNQPPKIKEKFPFELEADECVVSFKEGETVKYFKLAGVKELKQKIYQ